MLGRSSKQRRRARGRQRLTLWEYRHFEGRPLALATERRTLPVHISTVQPITPDPTRTLKTSKGQPHFAKGSTSHSSELAKMRIKGRSGAPASAHALDRRDITHPHQRANPSFDRDAADREPVMTAGGLQIWPKVSTLSSRETREYGKRLHQNHSASDSTTASDAGTLRSFYDPLKAPLAVSQQTSASAVRDRALRKGQPIIHVSSSQPDFQAPLRTRRSAAEPDDSPKSTRSHRSQKLDLSRFFGKNKGTKSSSSSSSPKPIVEESRNWGRAYKESDVQSVLTSDNTTLLSSGASQRSQNTVHAKDVTENAKVNVRRPPKGIQHWFEGLDESDDDDLPEVVQSPSPATFRPSLGPCRSRGAPTSRISPSYQVTPDYFHFGETPAHHSEMAGSVPPQASGIVDDHEGPNLQGQSMLNLSSSDDEASEPPSPACWPEQSLGINNGPASTVSRSSSSYQGKVDDARSSVFTMQTMMTSGSIPIINGDLFRGPLPAMPAVYAFPPTPSPSLPTPPYMQRMYSGRSQSRSRPPTVQSIPETVDSDYNVVTPGEPAHTMRVTQEEMVLLAMMRRKRVEMQAGHSPAENIQRQLALDRLNTSARSIASPPMSPSIDMMLGSPGGSIAFPAPPSISDKRPFSRLTRSASAERLHGHKYVSSSSSFRLKDKALPDAPTPHSEVLCELEAEPVEHLAPVCYSGPTLPLRRSRSSQVLSVRSPLLFNADDPYQLAPDLDFSPLDLLPLPSRMYSPSLTTSRSSMVGSHSSAQTPERASERDVDVDADADADTDADLVVVEEGDDDEEAEAAAALAEARKGSVKSLSSVGVDVLAAWGALGGV